MEGSEEPSKGLEEKLEELVTRWKGTEYKIVLEKLELADNWTEKSKHIKDS